MSTILTRVRWLFFGFISAALLALGIWTRSRFRQKVHTRLDIDIPPDPRLELNERLARAKADIEEEVAEMHPIEAANDVMRLLKLRREQDGEQDGDE